MEALHSPTFLPRLREIEIKKWSELWEKNTQEIAADIAILEAVAIPYQDLHDGKSFPDLARLAQEAYFISENSLRRSNLPPGEEKMKEEWRDAIAIFGYRKNGRVIENGSRLELKLPLPASIKYETPTAPKRRRLFSVRVPRVVFPGLRPNRAFT